MTTAGGPAAQASLVTQGDSESRLWFYGTDAPVRQCKLDPGFESTPVFKSSIVKRIAALSTRTLFCLSLRPLRPGRVSERRDAAEIADSLAERRHRTRHARVDGRTAEVRRRLNRTHQQVEHISSTPCVESTLVFQPP